MKTFRYALSVVISVLITTAVFIWIAAGEIYDYEDTFKFDQDADQVDVVLCLAGGKGRITAAAETWLKIKNIRDAKQLPPPVLFFSGVGPNAGFETLAEQGVAPEVLKKIGRENVVFENVSENTYENAQIFSSFAKQKHWKQALLITTGYHMRRAYFIFRKVMGSETDLLTETVDSVHFGRNGWRKDEYAMRVTIMEYFKWLYYRYTY